MKVRQITYFLALCEEQSFTRAARRCGVAQPSLTRAIQLLEQEIGGRLFERGNSSVRLTELGTLVRPDFARISQSTENIERTAARLLASSSDTSEQRPMGGFTRTLAALPQGATAAHFQHKRRRTFFDARGGMAPDR